MTLCSITGCDRPGAFARGWCGSHYKRWWRHGDPLAGNAGRVPNNATTETRLRHVGWTVVQVRAAMSPCWEWRGLLDPAGYGRIWTGARVSAAHRVAYIAWIGPLREDMLIRHHCDNPPCINPEHLGVGTDAENSADSVTRQRTPNGERRPHKLTDYDVAEIRAAFTGHRGQQAALARRYGVAPSYISVLVRDLARTEPTHWEAVHDDLVALGPGRAALRTAPPFVGNTRRPSEALRT